MAQEEFTPEELAEALYNLMLLNAKHVGDETVQVTPWQNLAIADQQPWHLLAKKAPFVMEGLEGLTFDVVAFKLFMAIQPPDLSENDGMEKYGQMHKLYHLMWESIARFLHATFDSEDGGLQDAFDVFHDWFKRKADAVPRVLIA